MSQDRTEQNSLPEEDEGLLLYLQTLTPLERLERHQQALELVRALRAAGERMRGVPARSAEGANSWRRWPGPGGD